MGAARLVGVEKRLLDRLSEIVVLGQATNQMHRDYLLGTSAA
jgi:hypothetical protein